MMVVDDAMIIKSMGFFAVINYMPQEMYNNGTNFMASSILI